MKHLIFILCIFALGCGVHNQKKAINDARLGLAIAGEATHMADLAAVEYFEEFPAEDTKMYCKGEIVTLVLEEVVSVLQAGADSVKLWETSLGVYLAKRDAGGETKVDWDLVLSSEAAWFQIAVDVVAVVDLAMREMEHAGQPVPSIIKYAWEFLYGMTGKPAREPYEMDWGDLKSGVCGQYLGGGP